jgi:hypothetical protein
LQKRRPKHIMTTLKKFLNRFEDRIYTAYNTDEDDPIPHSIMTKNLPLVIKSQSTKKKDKLKKTHYNILVYQILPYPPNTKEPHNHSKLN